MQRKSGRQSDRILLARIGALGDTIMALPVAQALKDQRESRPVDFLCSAGLAPLLELSSLVDHVYPLRHRNLPYSLSPEKQRLVRRLRARDYSRAVLMENAPRFVKLLRKTGIRQISSYADHSFDPGLHSVVNNLRLGGLEAHSRHPFEIRLELQSPACQGIEENLVGLGRPLIGIHPGYGPPGRKQGQTRRLKGWPRNSFVRLGQALQQDGAGLILTGSLQDVPDATRIAAHLEPALTRNLAGRTTLPQLAGLLGRLDLLVSVDSGPAHLAAALGVPLVVLWGPAKWVQTRPLATTAFLEILRHDLPCSPCYDTPAMKSCLRNTCMEMIRVEEAFEACRRGLGER